MRFAIIYLRLVGAMSLIFGVIYLVAPAAMLDAAGFGSIPAAGVTDVRATYGGFQIGMGAFLIWAASRESRVRGALLLIALSIGAVGASRALGLMLDGELNAFHLSGLATESLLTALTLFVISRLPSAGEAQAG